MIADYYKLKEQPFGVTPDTRYLYLSPTHREAFASLLYGVQSGRGFTSIIARPGMGKTILLFQLLQQLRQNTRTVFLFQTMCSPEELLRSLLHDLGLETGARDVSQMHFQLNECLLAESRRGKRLIVVIDEAQNLPDPVLELVRMFSNFETPREKLMQIILAGQPQLADKLASPNLVQLRQRISVIARLQPFTLQETKQYITHRLQVAGYDLRTPLFSSDAAAMIAQYSEGIPRNINNICFNALSLGYVLKQRTISAAVIKEVVGDLDIGLFGKEQRSARESTATPQKPDTPAAPLFAGANAPSSRAEWLPRTLLGGGLLAALVLAGSLGLWGFHRGKPFAHQLSANSQPPAVSEVKPAAASVSANAETPSAPLLGHPQGRNMQARNMKSSVVRRSVVKTEPPPIAAAPDVTIRVNAPPSHPAPETAKQDSPVDPAELWRQVGLEKTPAEVSLAKLYLNGTLVPQSCEQARLLLLAASKKGSKDAEDLLTDDYSRRCQ